ncbi:nitrous oxide reductase family maturation protein NosD [Campylobacter fetus]|uniref:Nitrous oxidase accessory protein n=3 Tax=Campylobacter fetus TaxID=196 RepID=A0RN59_CAMFF|nr:nitrous oxide reductase family maturation protein NosD [Campylobacter fetus]ABK83213.1 nitrous oxidase accessory protein [Campylobacter fetus subsp. fetus 82-40]EAI3886491.1 nitrous oxide reductase family maturation protein NosD [Campylobacter fetus]EAI3915571.1 nitrous oxide reductase family maturation protein NosD [Campylobacter fetus]EAI3919206.1 nitrous oxide reductase family maturation protein NosD [Campylobacter fetus]EAI8858488.1 nitrous oxide reductase family maturation protein NosD
MKKLCLFLLIIQASLANPLQDAIDSANPGDIIELGDAKYTGNIIINKAITIDGKNKAVIQGDEKGDVIKIMSSNVSLLNLNIQGSGDSHTTLDSAISCDQANEINIIGNHISDSLFGINFKQCNASVIKDNFITSKNVDLGLRGDAIRLWYSHDNIVENNHILKSRDMVIWYSSNNEIRKNIGEEGRYSLHFMYAGKNLVEDNIFKLNSVGIFFMFSSGSLVRNNQVLNSTGAFGVGIGMKDTSDFVIQNNILSYNARGLYLDQSPFQPGTINKFENNKILYNTVGVQFHATQHKSIFLENDFIGNMEVAINDTPGSKIAKNEWNKNYFDDYEGFDRNKDGIGDLPYQNYTYLDSLWQYHPNLRFFYGSSVISILNFIARLAPFSSQELLITDENPRIKRAYHE